MSYEPKMLRRQVFRHSTGSALIMALLCAAVLAGLGASALYVLQSRYRVIHQAASWKESLLTAEAGVEMAMNEVRKEMYAPSEAWSGWSESADGVTRFFTSRTLLRKGEGGQRSWVEIRVDAPESLVEGGEQWYRIRAVGIAEVPGGAQSAGERQDIRLRKLDLRFDRRTNKPVQSPQATRIIEAIAKPVGAFRLALFGTSSINLNDHNIVVDSWDSRNTEKYPKGLYPSQNGIDPDDPIRGRQKNGDIATNGQLIDAGGAHVYGNAMTNGGDVLNPQNVTGSLRSDFYQEVFPVVRPSVLPDLGTPLFIIDSTDLTAKPDSPSNYQFGFIKMGGNSVLRIKGAADGSPTYTQIVVTGDIDISGQAMITLDPGVFVRIFVQGDASFTGNGILNPNPPLNLQLYGTDRPRNLDGSQSHGTLKISGNGGFSGAVYAPTYNVEMKGGGNTDNIYGSFVGYTVLMTGIQSVHYDEAMADGGLVSDYKIVSWFEDEG